MNVITEITPPKKKSSRDTTIDIAKGIGIWLVYFAHAVNDCLPKDVIGAFHMPLFFLLSGLLFNPRKYGFACFLKRRIKSILIPLISFTLIGLAIGYATGTFGIEILMYDFLPAHWFLFVLFLCEVICYWPGHLSKSLMILCIIIFSVVGLYVMPQHMITYSFNSMFHASAFYLCGTLIRNNFANIFIKTKDWLNALIGITLIIILSIFVYFCGLKMDIKSNVMEQGYLLYLSSFIGAFGVLYLSRYLSCYIGISKCLCYFGRISLVIMGLHLILFGVLIRYKDVFPSTAIYAVWKLTIPMIICCAIASLFEKNGLKILMGKF